MAAILQPAATRTTDRGTIEVESQDTILIYFNGGFFDTELQGVDPQEIDGTRRVILAFAPDVALAEAMTARSRVRADRLVVSTLDEAWLRALADLRPQEGSER